MLSAIRFRLIKCDLQSSDGQNQNRLKTWNIIFIIFAGFVVLIGVLSNVVLIVVIRRSLLRKSLIYHSLLWIAVADNIRFLSVSFDFYIHFLEGTSKGLTLNIMITLSYIHGVSIPLQDAVLNSRKYIMATLSIIQLIMVVRPMTKLNMRLVNVLYGLIYFVNSVMVIPAYFLFVAEICPLEGRFIFKGEVNEPLWTYRTCMEVFIHTIITCGNIFSVSIALARAIEKRNKGKSQLKVESVSITKSLIKMNFIFIFCNIPQIVFGILFNSGYQPGFELSVRNLILNAAIVISCLNCCLNFGISYKSERRFRIECQRIICGKNEMRRSNVYSIKTSKQSKDT